MGDIKILDKKYNQQGNIESYKLEIDGECLGWINIDKCRQLRNKIYNVKLDSHGSGVIGDIGYIHDGVAYIAEERPDITIRIDITEYYKDIKLDDITIGGLEIVSEDIRRNRLRLHRSSIKNIKSDKRVKIGFVANSCDIGKVQLENVEEINVENIKIEDIILESSHYALVILINTYIKKFKATTDERIEMDIMDSSIESSDIHGKAVKYALEDNTVITKSHIKADMAVIKSRLSNYSNGRVVVDAKEIIVNELGDTLEWQLNGEVKNIKVNIDRKKILRLDGEFNWAYLKDMGDIEEISISEFGGIILNSNDIVDVKKINCMRFRVVDGAQGIKVYIHDTINYNDEIDREGLLDELRGLSNKGVEILTDYGSELHRQLISIKDIEYTVVGAPDNFKYKIAKQRMLGVGEVDAIIKKLSTVGKELSGETEEFSNIEYTLDEKEIKALGMEIPDVVFNGGLIDVTKTGSVLLKILRKYGIRTSISSSDMDCGDLCRKYNDIELGYMIFTKLKATWKDVQKVFVYYNGAIVEVYESKISIIGLTIIDDEYDSRIEALSRIETVDISKDIVTFRDVVDTMGKDKDIITLLKKNKFIRISYNKMKILLDSNGDIKIVGNKNSNNILKLNIDKKSIDIAEQKLLK